MAERQTGIAEHPDQATELACVLALATHAWRLSRLSKRAVERLGEEEAARLISQVRYLDRQVTDELAKLGVKLVELDGQLFDAGTAATALNAEDFGPDEPLYVVQTIEPVIVGGNGLLKYGVVMLGRMVA